MSGLNPFAHPECQQGEVFIGNFTSDEFGHLQRATKRKGSVVLFGKNPIDQSALPEWERRYPVFMQRKEIGRWIRRFHKGDGII